MLANTELLKGHWHFVEAIGFSIFTDDYTLTTIPGTKNSQGGYFIDGTDQYGDPVAASYWPTDKNWALLDPSIIIDNFFVFYTDGNTVLPGSCYYLISPPGSTNFSRCYPLTGVKTSAAAANRARQDSTMRYGEDQARAQAQETEQATAQAEQATAPVSPDVIEKYMLLKGFSAKP